jgi:hypothetical protein
VNAMGPSNPITKHCSGTRPAKPNARFSKRPLGAKRFQTIHDHSVDTTVTISVREHAAVFSVQHRQLSFDGTAFLDSRPD